MAEKIRIKRSHRKEIWIGNRHLGPVERQVLGKLIRQETVEEATQIVGQEMEVARRKDEGMGSLLSRLGIARKTDEEQRKVIWDWAIRAGLTPWEVRGVFKKWGIAVS